MNTKQKYIVVAIVIIIIILLCCKYSSKGCTKDSRQSSMTIQMVPVNTSSPRYETTVSYYYNPGCPHCRNFMGTWKEFSTSGREANFSEINCSTNPERCTKIKGVPYVVFSRNGKHFSYDGQRDISSLNNFLTEFNQ